MPVQDGGHPVEVGTVVAQQTGAGTLRAVLRAGSDVDVVVELEIPDAPLSDQPVHDGVEVGPGGRVAQIQVVPTVFRHAQTAAPEERLGRQGVGQRAAHADDFGLQPQSRDHAVPPDRVQHLLDAAGKRPRAGCHAPTASHQPWASSSYHPASMTKTSAPALPPPRRAAGACRWSGRP